MKSNLLVLGLVLMVSGQMVQAAAAVKPVTPASAAAAPVVASGPTETQKKVIADAQAAWDAASKKFVDATASITAILSDPAKTTAATNDGSLAKLVELSKVDEKEVNDKLQILTAAKNAAGIK